jgi:hypothetical protein
VRYKVISPNGVDLHKWLPMNAEVDLDPESVPASAKGSLKEVVKAVKIKAGLDTPAAPEVETKAEGFGFKTDVGDVEE